MLCSGNFGFLVWFVLVVVHLVIVKSGPRVSLNPKDSRFTIQYLIQLKQLSKRSPYTKFGRAYDKFNVCELRYVQKIFVCDTILSSRKFRYKTVHDENAYMDLPCRRRLVDLSRLNQITDTKQLLLSMYECPNPYKTENRFFEKNVLEVEFFIPINFFIIGGYFRNSVLLSYKHAASRPLPIKFHTLFLGVSLEKLEHLYFEQRSEIYDESSKMRKITKPKIRRVVGKAGPIDRNHIEADAKVLNRDWIIKEPTYKKFMSTYKIKNICAMGKEKKLTLCRQFFETSAYKLFISEPDLTDTMFSCIRREVILLHMFAESDSTNVASIECPILKDLTTNLFFLGSMHRKQDGVVSFMRIPPFLQLLPDAVVTALDSEGLIKKPGLLSIPRTKEKKRSLLEDKLSIVNDLI